MILTDLRRFTRPELEALIKAALHLKLRSVCPLPVEDNQQKR